MQRFLGFAIREAQTGSWYECTPSRSVWCDAPWRPTALLFVTFEHLSGESDKGPKLAASLWNVADKQARPLPGNLSPVPIFSPDSKTLAIQEMDEADTRVKSIILFLDVASASPKSSIPILDKNASRLGYMAFSPDGDLLVGQVRDETNTGEHSLKLWDAATGLELASFPGEKRNYFLNMAFSLDGRTGWLLTTIKTAGPSNLLMFDSAQQDIAQDDRSGAKHVGAAADVQSRQQVDRGRHSEIPARIGSSRAAPASEPEQGRIHVVSAGERSGGQDADAAAGNPGESSVRFSLLDGKTLAASGKTGVCCCGMWSNLNSK